MRSLIYTSIFLVTLFGVSGSTHADDETTSVEPLTHGNRNRRFVGGKNTMISLFPHYVSIEYYGNHICGGAIISLIYVLTAARCSVRDKRKLLIHAGSDQEGVNGTSHHVYRFVLHDNYTSSLTNGNDIAVIQVVEPFKINMKHDTIQMLNSNEKVRISSAVDVVSLGNSDRRLKHITSYVSPCNIQKNYFAPPGTFCVGDFDTNICSRDVGAPVTIGLRLAGIVLHETNCKNSPGIVTNVAFFRNWILNVTHI